MTKQQLEFFLSAAEFCNFSKAASFHFVSIPTFTRHINDLETELSTKLFTRNNRGVNLTEAGALFHPIARVFLDSMYDYYDIVKEKDLLEGEAEERFIIGYYPFGGMFINFSKLKENYLEMWLKVPSSLRCIATGKMTEMVNSGKLDVGAVSKGQIEKHGDEFRSRLFFKSYCNLLVDPDHELASRDNITVQELAEKYGDYSLYLPVGKEHLKHLAGKKITCKADIREICKHYLDLLPELLVDNKDARKNMGRMIIGTDNFHRPELSGKHVLSIEGGNVPMEVWLFWRKDNNSELIKRFEAALDFAGI